jgi:glycerol-3-phosphate dehydrogenase
MISVSGLITLLGGKWTTYRKIAEDAVDNAIMLGGLPDRQCVTKHLPVHGFRMDLDPRNDPMAVYGLDKEKIIALEEEKPELENLLSEKLQIRKSQVIWAVEEEMARTVEDVLARRTRALFLDARESVLMAPHVAAIMAQHLNRDKIWIEEQIRQYEEMAENYYFT